MAEVNHQAPGFTVLLGRLARTVLGALRNRVELFAVEWREERRRMMQLLGWGVALLLAVMLTALLFTATIIFLFTPSPRLYVAAGFTVLYAIGAVVAWLGLKQVLAEEPFVDRVDQAQKDRAWLESLK